MRRRLLNLALALLLTAPLMAASGQAADNANPSDGAAIRQIIESQLEAFRRDDGASAFSFASPDIQRKFGSASTFMEMVRNGYPSVYRPQTVEFRELRLEGNVLQQEVFFVGPDGKAVIAIYSMEQQPDGSWRINGVRLIAAPDMAV